MRKWLIVLVLFSILILNQWHACGDLPFSYVKTANSNSERRETKREKKHTANLNEHMVITRAITSQAFSYKPYPPSLQLPKRNTNYTTLVGNQQTEKKIP